MRISDAGFEGNAKRADPKNGMRFAQSARSHWAVEELDNQRSSSALRKVNDNKGVLADVRCAFPRFTVAWIPSTRLQTEGMRA